MNQNKTTPTFDKLILSAIRQQSVNTFTSIPGKVVSIKGNLVTVEITIKRTVNNKATPYPLIHNVPLRREAVGPESYLHFPVEKGTTGMIIFSQRSLERWIDSDGQTAVDPSDLRIHDISDATFWPGLMPKRKAVPTSKNAVLRHNRMSIELSPDGKVKMEGATGEVMSMLSELTSLTNAIDTELLNLISAQTTKATAEGTLMTAQATAVPLLGPPNTAYATALTAYGTTLGTISTQLTSIKSQLTTLKSKIDGMAL